MHYLYILAIILHVATAAAWFGLSAQLPSLARKIASSTSSQATVLAESGVATVEMMSKYSVLLYAFALAAILFGPGFAGLGWNLHIALSLGLILILVQVFLIRRNWRTLQLAVDGGNPEAARKKVSMSVGIGHLVWFILLVLMFLPRLMAV